MDTKINDEKNNMFCCPYCGQTFKQRTGVPKHVLNSACKFRQIEKDTEKIYNDLVVFFNNYDNNKKSLLLFNETKDTYKILITIIDKIKNLINSRIKQNNENSKILSDSFGFLGKKRKFDYIDISNKNDFLLNKKQKNENFTQTENDNFLLITNKLKQQINLCKPSMLLQNNDLTEQNKISEKNLKQIADYFVYKQHDLTIIREFINTCKYINKKSFDNAGINIFNDLVNICNKAAHPHGFNDFDIFFGYEEQEGNQDYVLLEKIIKKCCMLLKELNKQDSFVKSFYSKIKQILSEYKITTYSDYLAFLDSIEHEKRLNFIDK